MDASKIDGSAMSKKNNLVVQHNAIIEARDRLSVGEQRLIKTLASMIGQDDAEFKPYTLRVADFAELVGIGRKDYHAAVKETAESLMSRPFTLMENGESVTMTWFSSVRYKIGRGVVEIRFDPSMKPYLLQLKERFTKYELGNVLRLKKTYSIRMYELCKQYQSLGHRRFDIDQLREILCLDAGYSLYGNIKNRVLLDSQKELAEKTDISFDFEEIKEGRKVVAVEITIRTNQTGEAQGKPVESPPNPASESVQNLVALGVSRAMAVELAAEYDAERIARGIAYAQAQQKEGKVKNAAGFLVKAIKDGYRDSQTEERERKAEKAAAAAREETIRKEWNKVKKRWVAWCEERTEAHIAAMDAATLEREKAAFRASIAGNFAMQSLVEKRAENETRYFRIYIAGKMAGLGLAEWARVVGMDLSPFLELARREGKIAPA